MFIHNPSKNALFSLRTMVAEGQMRGIKPSHRGDVYSQSFKKCPSPLAGEGGRRPDEG